MSFSAPRVQKRIQSPVFLLVVAPGVASFLLVGCPARETAQYRNFYANSIGFIAGYILVGFFLH